MKTIVSNKKAKYNFVIFTSYESGIVLTGSEVKSVRRNNVNINEAFVLFKKDEAFVVNMFINQYEFSSLLYNFNPYRIRKLLLHKKEILKIKKIIKLKKLTVVVLKMYLKKNYIKLEIGLVKGKKIYDKREAIKKRDIERIKNL